jgi:Xaa-Pro aminopeptidase
MVDIYHKRRQNLIEQIKSQYQESGLIVLFGAFERDAAAFLQESNFYYLTGINEAGAVLVANLDHEANLWIADTAGLRSKWVTGALSLEMASKLGFNEIKYLGKQISGYEPNLFIKQENYANLIQIVDQAIASGNKIFTVKQNKLEQTFILDQLAKFIPGLNQALVDVSDLIAELRRYKSEIEIDHICQAIDITGMAHEAAAKTIAAGMMECEVQAAIEYLFIAAGSSTAFPSIVGSGQNSTIMHYFQNDAKLEKDDLVVVDIGARYKNYCADITRTYPVSGKFNKRQREIYELVLETQAYIAELAAPGFWLANSDQPDKSLLHLAREFMQERGGYDKYFTHGIGHYLGLDVHDVGSRVLPLQEGDIITIEPGIYIPAEKLGVRIEDNYLVTAKGVICLSEQIEKSVEQIEKQVSSGRW